MEVKEKTTKKTTKTYVACDGREFDNKYACMNHEREIKAGEARKRVETLPNFEMLPPFAPENETWRWFYVNSQENVDDIAMSLFEKDSVAHEFHPKSFPCWVVAVRTDDFSLGKGWMMEHSEYDDKMDEFNSELEDELAKRKPKKDGSAYSEGFEKFWAAYPLKTGKSAAFSQYLRRLRDAYSDEALLGAAQNYADDCRKKKVDKRFMKYASSFLSAQGAYADYLPGFYRNNGEGEAT